jgi:DNA mismatch repair protein MutS
MALIQSYYQQLAEYQKKYGPRTFLLMQVGSFFEVYAKSEDHYIQEFSRIGDLKIAAKGEHYMAGFRDYLLDKYTLKLNEANYTTVVHVQEEVGGVIRRREQGVYSPGTYFLEEDVRLSNHTCCIWIHQTKRTPSTLLFGISVMDIYTGKVHVYEYQELYYQNPTTYDSVERFLSVYHPSEMVIIHNMDKEIETIVQYLSKGTRKVVQIALSSKDEWSQQAAKCESQSYQSLIVEKFYPSLSRHLIEDLLFEKAIAFQSLCFLLEYIHNHNPALTQHISEPELETPSTLVLANHSLKQLNMIDTDYKGDYSSVSRFLNTCRTRIGKREFDRMLFHPSLDPVKLQQSYDMTEHCCKQGYAWAAMLSRVCDIEKIYRKIVLGKATPHDYSQLYSTCSLIEDHWPNDDIWSTFCEKTETFQEIQKVQETLTAFFDMAQTVHKHVLDDTCDTLICRGVDAELDQATRDKLESRLKFNAIQTYLNNLYQFKDPKCEQAFALHETEKSGSSLLITKRRKAVIEKSLKKTVNLTFFSDYSKQEETFTFDLDKISFREHNGQKYEIVSDELTLLTHTMIKTEYEFLQQLTRVYRTIHAQMNFSYHSLIACIQKMDVYHTKSEIATKYHYCKPVIEKQDTSFLRAKKMRHVLIEHLEKQEAYVPNDVELGPKSILLFGTNAVGKTSLIKSIGICIIMAQAGLYVPCDEFTYCPYEYLFTRIIGNDNMFKGLSTFAVEMSELRVILQKSNAKSLVLGDELCSGTENDSALSIFMAGIEHLYAVKSSFIFATHFHAIQHFKEIKEMPHLCLMHLTVRYNPELQKLFYGRTLQEGAGESVYGLEVCKSLQLPDAFLERAYALRNWVSHHTSILTMRPSRYNRDKIVTLCEFCKKEMGTETHHLQYQKDAVQDYIGTMDKNHPSNLASICETCHKHIHALNLVYEKRKNIDGTYSIILLKD